MVTIALCGPGGSGKSTLAEDLGKRLNLPMLPSATRTVIRDMGLTSHPNLAELPLRKRLALQTRALMLHVQNEVHAGSTGFVSDRTVWDFMAYMETFVAHDSTEASWYRQLPTMMGHEGYDLVVYVPSFNDAPAVADGVRYTGDQAWVEDKVRNTMLDLVRCYRPDVLCLTSKSPEDRVMEIISNLR